MPVLVPVLEKNKLTWREAVERLKLNPNDPDPEVQKAKETLENFAGMYIPKIQEAVQLNLQVVESFKSALVGIDSFSSTIKAINESVYTPLKFYRDFAKSFTISNYVLDSIRNVAKDINQLTLPTKMLAQSFAMLNTPALFTRLPELDSSLIINATVIEKPKITTSIEYEKQLVREEIVLSGEVTNLAKIAPTVEEKPYFYYPRTKTFLIKIVDYAAITLSTKRDTDGMSIFFETCIKFLDTLGGVVGDVIKVFIPLKQFQAELASKGIREPNMNWIKSTKSNLVNHKIPVFLSDVVGMSDYDVKAGGFYFWIRVSKFHPILS